MKSPADKDAAIARYREGPVLLERTVAGLKDTDLDTVHREGGWTVRQIVHHIVDGDDLWKLGIKMALGNEQAEFSLDWYRVLSQDEWTKRWAYSQRSIEESLALFKAIRNHVVQLLETVPDGWDRSVGFRKENDEIEKVPVGFIIGMQADHVEHHVKQIETISK